MGHAVDTLLQGAYSMTQTIVCQPKLLPKDLWAAAAFQAAQINPLNYPAIDRMALGVASAMPLLEFIAVVTTKYWQTKGVNLTVAFLDGPPADLRSRILSHLNAWGKSANVRFAQSDTNPQVRIARTARDGHWSYVGTDILSIPADQATMNLDSFTSNTPDAEFYRVVRHEAGHTLGFPHEHMRRELIARIDPVKALAYFKATQGWSETEVRRQVLTPIEESSILGTDHADPNSIMCYQIPGTLTKDGKPISGGRDIDASDYAFVAKIYPLSTAKKKKKPVTKKRKKTAGSRRPVRTGSK